MFYTCKLREAISYFYIFDYLYIIEEWQAKADFLGQLISNPFKHVLVYSFFGGRERAKGQIVAEHFADRFAFQVGFEKRTSTLTAFSCDKDKDNPV